MATESEQQRGGREGPAEPAHPARLYALLAGAGLSLLGVLGFFYDAEFEVGDELASDDLSGVLMVNGWSNAIHLATGLLALAFAPLRARATALLLGGFYLVLALWGFAETDRGIGSILDAIPLGNEDNVLHLALGALGLIAFAADPATKLRAARPRIRIPRRIRRRSSA